MTQVSLEPLVQGLWPFVLTALGAVITGAVGFAAAALRRYTGIIVEQHSLALFDQAATTQAGKWIAQQAEGWERQSISVDNPLVAFAVKEVFSRISTEANKIGITEEKLRDMILGKIGVLQSQALGRHVDGEKK